MIPLFLHLRQGEERKEGINLFSSFLRECGERGKRKIPLFLHLRQGEERKEGINLSSSVLTDRVNRWKEKKNIFSSFSRERAESKYHVVFSIALTCVKTFWIQTQSTSFFSHSSLKNRVIKQHILLGTALNYTFFGAALLLAMFGLYPDRFIHPRFHWNCNILVWIR